MKNFEEYGIFKSKKRNYKSILYVVSLIHGVLERRFNAYFAAHGTSAPKYNILMAVAYINGGEGLNQKELGRHLITSAGNVTKLVESLHTEGLVTRVANKLSRRENIIKITKKGSAFIEKLWPDYDAMVSRAVNGISKAKQKELISILESWFLSLKE